MSLCDSIFSLHEYYTSNPNGEGVRNWIANQMSKFHDDPMVKEVRIIALLNRFWVSTRKERAMMRRTFLLALTIFYNSQRWECSEMSSNMVLTFHNDPTANESKMSFFLNRFGGMREKERVLGGRGGKTLGPIFRLID